MSVAWMNVYRWLAVALLITPLVNFAQDDDRSWRDTQSERQRPRGELRITNDWRDEVNVSVWTQRRERIGEGWSLEPGRTALLLADGQRIRVRPNYKIKVGDDWGWTNVGDVGEFRRGVWYVNVRDIWRATHRRGEERNDERRDEPVPDWQR